jgi:hypothetical protein
MKYDSTSIDVASSASAGSTVAIRSGPQAIRQQMSMLFLIMAAMVILAYWAGDTRFAGVMHQTYLFYQYGIA